LDLFVTQSNKNKLPSNNNGKISIIKYSKFLILINKNITIEDKKNKIAPNNDFFQDIIKMIKRINVGILWIKNPNNIALNGIFWLNVSKENIPIKQVNNMLTIRGNQNINLFFIELIININL